MGKTWYIKNANILETQEIEKAATREYCQSSFGFPQILQRKVYASKIT